MTGDYNGDGYVDILLIAKRRVILIDYDIPIPIALPTPSPSFVLLSSGPSTYTLSTDVTAQMLSSPVWQSGGYDLTYGDVSGNGAGGLFLRSTTAGGTSFTIVASAANGVPQLTQVISIATLGMDLGGSGISIQLGDTNGDGRADLSVLSNGVTIAVFLADSNGRFAAPDDQSSIGAVWLGLWSSFANSDTSRALQYISPDARSTYQSMLAEVGAEAMRVNAARWSAITVVSQSGSTGMGSISVVDDGSPSTYIITFSRVNGLWYVESF
jgi:hypothetical protein